MHTLPVIGTSMIVDAALRDLHFLLSREGLWKTGHQRDNTYIFTQFFPCFFFLKALVQKYIPMYIPSYVPSLAGLTVCGQETLD